MELLGIGDVLKKEKSDFKYWHQAVNTEILKNSCKKCHGPIICAYADMGTTDYCDTYQHICMNPKCDYIEKIDIHSMNMGTRDESGPLDCPFCGRRI